MKMKKRLLSSLLSLVMMLGLVPGMSLTAYADDPYASLKNTITVVHFDSKDWYLIDYDSSTVTLLSKECVAASMYDSNGLSYVYSGSTVETAVNNYYTSSISSDAKAAVSGSGMFLLTTAQATTLSIDVRKCSQYSGTDNNRWWLCSPGRMGGYAACVYGSAGGVDDGGHEVGFTYGVRPALKLNLSSVIFSSESNTFFVKEPTPTATFTATGADTGTLSGVADGMKYSLGGTTWVDITSNADIDLTGLSAGSIQVVKKGDGTTAVDSDPKTITVTKATAPTTAAAVNCTTADNNDGKLTGVEITMEYKKSDDAAWTAGTGNVITGLVPGTYYVRVKATGTALASANQELTIKAVQTIAAENVYATFGDTDKSVSASVTNPATGVGVITYAVKEGSGNYIGVNANGALTIKAVPPADGKAYVTVTAAGTDTCVETTKDVTVTVGKANAAPATVTANNRTYDGTEKSLVTVTGAATGGEMQYAIGTATEATQPYTTSIPSKTDAGTYTVWYKVVGDGNHNDTAPACVSVTIRPADKAALNDAIKAAEEYYNSIANYPDIAAKLKTAIDAAKAVAGNDNAAEGDVAKAVSTLNGAVNAARADVQAAEEAAAKRAADEAAAQAVIDAINALPDNAGAGDKDAVAAARAAYDNLTDDQKRLVSPEALNRLIAAEQQVKAAEEAEKEINISECEITVGNVTYTGKAVTAKAMEKAVTVRYDGMELKYGADYTLRYSKKLKAIGPGKVTVVGKGRCSGSQEAAFNIVPRGTAFKKLTGGVRRMTLKWKKQKGINGYQIEYSLKEDFSGSGKVKIGKARTLSTTIKKLQGNKTYYVRIRTYTTVKKKNYYSAWSKTKTVRTKGGNAKNASAEQVVNAAMNVGEALPLKPLIPSDVSDDGLTWDAGDAEIATVSQEGVLTALQPGEAVITMTNADGDRVVFVVTISAGDIILLDDEPLTLPEIEDIGDIEETEAEIELELEVEMPGA